MRAILEVLFCAAVFLLLFAYYRRALKAGKTPDEARYALLLMWGRVIGASFVAVGILMLVGIVWTWPRSAREGDPTSTIGALLFVGFFVLVGVFLLFRGHARLIEWSRENAQAQREIEAQKRRKD